MSIFRKCHIKLFLIVQVGDPFRLWLHFYSVFEFPPKSVFHYFGLSRARLEKCIFQSAENFKEHRFHFFDILRILEPDVHNIHIPGPRKSFFHYFGLSWARLEKCIVQSAENFKEQRFNCFDILRILEPDFQNIHIPGPRKSVLGPGDVLGAFWGVQKSSIYLPFWKFSMNLGWSVI